SRDWSSDVCSSDLDHGVEGIGHQDDASQERDFLPGETEGISPAVVALVVIEDRLRNPTIETVDRHSETQLRMPPHVLQLGLIEWPRLGENGRVDVDLADVVQDAH